METTILTKYTHLLDQLRGYGQAIVAFSGGVDSLLLLHAAVDALGSENVEAVIGVSPTLPKDELNRAREYCRKLGVVLRELETEVMEYEMFTVNPAERCYHCRVKLSHVLLAVGGEGKTLMDGANADDLNDYRPGIRAADEHGILHPLVLSGIGKQDVRDLLKYLAYPEEVYNRPSSPCLSSRFPYGDEITNEKLGRVEQGEGFLRELGFRELRVRHYDLGTGPTAIVEIADSEHELINDAMRTQILGRLKGIGFTRVYLNLEGFRSGSLNDALDLGGEEEGGEQGSEEREEKEGDKEEELVQGGRGL